MSITMPSASPRGVRAGRGVGVAGADSSRCAIHPARAASGCSRSSATSCSVCATVVPEGDREVAVVALGAEQLDERELLRGRDVETAPPWPAAESAHARSPGSLRRVCHRCAKRCELVPSWFLEKAGDTYRPAQTI
jgi:hypothetical protein